MALSEAHKRASKKYNEKTYEQISFRSHQDGSDGFTREIIVKAAAEHNESVNQYIIKAIRDRLNSGN